MDPAPLPAVRVAHLNSKLTGGGTDDQCVKLALALKKLGQQVWVAGPGDREFSRVVRRLDIPFHTTPTEGPLKGRIILDVAKFIRRKRVQILHGHHGNDLWPSILAAKLSGVRPKVVLTRHMAKSPSSWFSRRLLLRGCDALLAVSEFVAKVLTEGVCDPTSPEPERHSRPPMMGDHRKIRVVYGGIDTGRFNPQPRDTPAVEALRREWGLAPDHFAFAVVGGYDFPQGKGQGEFLSAAARIHGQLSRARFLLIGRGNMKEKLEKQIDQLGLTGKAWLTRYCHDMPCAMNAIDCLVHPQIGTEALGLVVCEAHACGRPVIASNLDGIPEAFAIAGYGRLVGAENVDELAAALHQWANQPPLDMHARIQLHARVKAKFSLEALGRNVLAVYHQLLYGPMELRPVSTFAGQP